MTPAKAYAAVAPRTEAAWSCRQVGKEEDPFSLGLVLEWVYGTIVSTAEKSRDGAKRPLGALSMPGIHVDM